jgi:hypothetical protein
MICNVSHDPVSLFLFNLDSVDDVCHVDGIRVNGYCHE